MRKVLLIALSMVLVAGIFAQKSTAFKKNDATSAKNAMIADDAPYKMNTAVKADAAPYKGTNDGEIAKYVIGESANIYSVLVEQQQCLSFDPSSGTFMATHRANPEVYPDAVNSGTVMTHVSTDMGQTWTPYYMYDNTTTDPVGRYPSGVIFNPTNSTNVNDVYGVTCGPTHTGGTWDYVFYSTGKLDGLLTNHDTQLDPINADYETSGFVRNGLSACDDGKVHVAAPMYDLSGDYATTWDINTMTGTFDEVTGTFSWESVTVSPPWAKREDETLIVWGSTTMAWDNSGENGYLITDGILEDVVGYGSYQPIVYKTTDGGVSWEMIDIELTDFDIWEEENYLPASGTEDVYWPYVKGLMEGAVDHNGNLQLFAVTKAAYSLDPDSLGYTYLYDFGKIFRYEISEDGVEDVYYVDSVMTVDVATDDIYAYAFSGDPVGYDHRLQVSRSDDGTNMFCIWVDSHDTTKLSSGDNPLPTVAKPDIFGYGINLETEAEEWNDYTSELSADDDLQGRYWFTFVAQKANQSGDGYRVGVSTTITPLEFILNDELAPVTHTYIDGVDFFNYNPSTGQGENIASDLMTVSQNQPNPFTKNSTIEVNLNASADLSMEIYNMLGQVVFVENKGEVNTGRHLFNVNGADFESGVYFYTIKSGTSSVTKKMIIE